MGVKTPRLNTESVAYGRRRGTMCYNRREHRLEEETRRRLRQHEEEEACRREREAKSRRAAETERKPLIEKVREVVGSAR
jgi:hypothetical protein